jgi:hydroxymethylglutaryl-CoA lyase
MSAVKLVEVGPRDGLQNEKTRIPTAAKAAFVDALSATGVGEIEVSAFVSPRRVPQLDDAEAVFHGIRRAAPVVYSALVPNERGLVRAMACGVDKIAVFTAVSETFNRNNIHTTLDGSLRRFRPLIRQANAVGLPVRGYLSTAFWCAFEGRILPEQAISAAEALFRIGVDEVSISDTVGKATPEEVAELLDGLLRRVPPGRIAMHFHDTFGHAAANVRRSWDYGIRIFDASVGGLGGCPFSPGATGNVATEDVAAALTDQGAEVNVDLQKLAHARQLLDPYLGEERRARPPKGERACETCDYFAGEVCCAR